MKRIWTFVIDLLDGVFASLLYGSNNRTVWTYRTEAENQAKMRQWAAGGEGATEPDRAADSAADLDARIRHFRRGTSEPRELK
jgi:hypothetical protein